VRVRDRIVVVIGVGLALAGVARADGAEAIPPAARVALDAVLACEREGGGFTYVCDPPTGPHGAVTWPLLLARRLAAPLGLDRWDVVVLRSPGTPAAGLVLLDAWRRSGEARYLAAARRAGELLLQLQLSSGGWFSEVPVHGTAPARWFSAIAHWATLDDDVTPGAARFLLALHDATGDARYRDAAERGLDLLLAAQLPSGAWPLTWRPAWAHALRATFEDLPSTNDAATAGPIQAMLVGARALGRPDLLAAARRGAEWLVAAQGPDTQAGWAQQYDATGRPAPGRRFEPAAFASWESRLMIEALLAVVAVTGDTSLCEPVARGVAWLDASTIGPACWARFYAPGTNAPVYIGPDGRPVATPDDARRPYRWTGDYGIPALFASLGVDPADDARAGPPPRRIPGDAGACPPAVPPEEHADGGPRMAILRAAIRLAALAPPEPSPCAAAVQRRVSPAGVRARDRR
jgi:Pectic acid lyase